MAPQQTSSISVDQDGIRHLTLEVTLPSPSHDDVTVRLQDDNVIVLSQSKELTRVPLVESVDPFTVRATVDNGVLTIVAPLAC